MKKELFAAIAISALALQTSQAEVKLGSIWGDGMVLQRSTNVLFSGVSDGSKVTITTSWSGKQKYKAVVSADGSWSVEIPTPDADNISHTITFNDGDRLTLTDVLLGDLWLCLGQSNMQMPMSGFGYKDQPIAGNQHKHQHVVGGAEVISRANPSQNIRLYTAEYNPQNRPQSTNGGEWLLNTPWAVRGFSAAGYFFGKTLQESLNIPIGLISVNRGASSIETWMSREALESVGKFNFSSLDSDKLPKNVVSLPCYHYNGMIAPLEGVAVKGAIWYQGESNKNRREEYLKLFPAFAKEIRGLFRGGEFPIYYAQIAPYKGSGKFDLALMREVMTKLMDLTPRTGMVALTDIGEEQVIHPRFKREVGERFAMWALSDTYGDGCVECRAPEYKSMQVTNDPVVKQKGVALSFDYATTGVHFKERNQTSTQFEIAGEDRVFHPAKVKSIDRGGALLWVWSEEVKEPVAVRYAFHNYAEGDVYSASGMALSLFRTDDWECE